MAKGFTVKSKIENIESDSIRTENLTQDDIQLVREKIRGKKIIFCLPGRGCSFLFLKNFVQLCFEIIQAGATVHISQDYSSVVNFARCKCLGANVLNGPDQLPWNGTIDYDYQLWIDSDIVFGLEQFYRLFLIDKPIVAGWYLTEDGRTTSCAHWLNSEDFKKNKGMMNHETIDTITKRKKPFTVDYTGFGWTLIKKGVFEHSEIKYPWFPIKLQTFDDGKIVDFCGEDVGFCLDAISAGFEIWIDPLCRVGHEKTRIL